MNGFARFIVVSAPLVVLAVASVLLVSALLKAAEPEAFRELLARHGLLPASWLGPTAAGVWIAELAGGLLAVRCALRGSLRSVAFGALLMGAVFLGFSVYAAVLTVHPPPKPSPCGCLLGDTPVSDWGPVTLRNGCCAMGLAGLALVARCVDSGSRRRVTPPPPSPNTRPTSSHTPGS